MYIEYKIETENIQNLFSDVTNILSNMGHDPPHLYKDFYIKNWKDL